MSGGMEPPAISPYALNLRHLNAVRAVAQHGSLGRAAEAVFLSQPAITQALAKLERMLGVRLFDRRPGGMAATEAGGLLVTRADRATAHLAEAARALKGVGRGTLPIERLLSATHLRALVAVVGHGNFAIAARETELSQPALHRAVRDLERIAGTPLLVRQGRTVRTTAAAERFVRHARLAMAELAAGLDEIATLQGRGGGRIAIGAMPLARARIVPRAITRLAAEHPEMRFEVVEGPYPELLAALRAGELDLLIGALRDPAPADDVIERLLFEDRAIIVAGAHHPLARRGAGGVAALCDYPWIMARAGTPLRAQWEAVFAEAGIAPPEVRVACGSVVAITGMLIEGDWLTLLSPEQVRRELADGTLVTIGTPIGTTRRAIGTTIRAEWLPSAAQRRFMALLGEAVAQTSAK